METKKNSLIISIFILLVVGVALYFLSSMQPKTAPLEDFEPYQATLSGTYLCLPHVDMSGPQTMECAFGLQTDDGIYYAIDFGLMSQTPPELSTGQRITASGVVTPVERLNNDQWRKYPIKAIFSVTNSVIVE
jgi:hypothetical protein